MQLLAMPVKISSHAAQNVVCLYGTKAMSERGAFTQSS